MTYRLGIIGAGAIGSLHADAARRAGVNVAAVCDVALPVAEALASQHDGARAVGSVDELLAGDIDAAVVAVPNNLHKDTAIKALQAGKDVLLEKPMALDPAECDEILAARDRNGRLLQLGFVCRCAPTTRVAAEFIAAGRLGTIYHAKAILVRRRGIPGLGRWFTTKASSGGGVLIDLGVHVIDLVRNLLGSPTPTRVSAHVASQFGDPIDAYNFTEMWAGPPNPDGVFDVEDHANGLIRFDSGLTLEVTTTWASNIAEGLLPNGIYLFGDKGGCFFDIWTDRIEIATEDSGRIVDLKPHLTPGDHWTEAWRRQHEQFAEAVRTRTPPTASGEDGRFIQAVLDAMYRSSEAGREVEV